jgi:hypothetical protein
LRDIMQESPDGRHLAVVYACGEVGVCKEVGRLALLAGPPSKPRLLLRPWNLTCLVSYADRTIRWLDGRYCLVTPYCIWNLPSGKIKVSAGSLYLDVEQRKAAFLANVYPGAAVPDLPSGLRWRAWSWLLLWPFTWNSGRK